jgi:hypothetical protein
MASLSNTVITGDLTVTSYISAGNVTVTNELSGAETATFVTSWSDSSKITTALQPNTIAPDFYSNYNKLLLSTHDAYFTIYHNNTARFEVNTGVNVLGALSITSTEGQTPIIIDSSTTQCPNLNADYIGDQHSTGLLSWGIRTTKPTLAAFLTGDVTGSNAVVLNSGANTLGVTTNKQTIVDTIWSGSATAVNNLYINPIYSVITVTFSTSTSVKSLKFKNPIVISAHPFYGYSTAQEFYASPYSDYAFFGTTSTANYYNVNGWGKGYSNLSGVAISITNIYGTRNI